MSKPINVEAQRVAKIIDDTEARLGILGVLSHDLFTEIKARKSEDDLKATFGSEAGKLLFDQATCEDKFGNVNSLNGQTMEPLDSQEFLPDQKRSAIQNARDIERQILRLLRIFSRKDMRDKLAKEFGVNKSTNEIEAFNEQFKQLKKLWTTKLCTPLEEVTSMQESLVKLRQSTTSLKEQLRIKEDGFLKFQESAKDQREQRQKELEDLKNQQNNKKSDKSTQEDDLKSAGQLVEKQHEEEHKERKQGLQKQIDSLNKQLEAKTVLNGNEETKLTTAFESADKMYAEALDSYDTELKNHHAELQECNKEFDERNHELKMLQEEWHHRQEERRKTEEIQNMMQKKEEDQRKKMELLSKGAEWIQAHWRGLIARKEAEKARKKKKKGRKGKK